MLPSASTERSMVPTPPISSEAELTVNPEAEPVIDKASCSAAALSELVVSVKVPDFDPVPAAITTSNVS